MAENTEGKIVHSEVEISVDPNCTTAFMTITAPENGGRSLRIRHLGLSGQRGYPSVLRKA